MTEASVRDPVCLGIALRRTDSLLSTDWCPLGAGSCPDAAGTHPPVAAELGLVAWKARKDRGLSVYTYNMYDIYICLFQVLKLSSYYSYVLLFLWQMRLPTGSGFLQQIQIHIGSQGELLGRYL